MVYRKGDIRKSGESMRICELCGSKSDELEKSLIMATAGTLEEYQLCQECVDGVNNAEDEIKFIKGRKGQANAIT